LLGQLFFLNNPGLKELASSALDRWCISSILASSGSKRFISAFVCFIAMISTINFMKHVVASLVASTASGSSAAVQNFAVQRVSLF